MRDPRTKIELPTLSALIPVLVFCTLGFAVAHAVGAVYEGGTAAYPFRFAGSTLILAAACAWCLRSLTIDARPGHDLTRLPVAQALRLPGHVVAVPSMGPTDDGCLREYHIPEGQRIVGHQHSPRYGVWPAWTATTDATRLDPEPLNAPQRAAMSAYLAAIK